MQNLPTASRDANTLQAATASMAGMTGMASVATAAGRIICLECMLHFIVTNPIALEVIMMESMQSSSALHNDASRVETSSKTTDDTIVSVQAPGDGSGDSPKDETLRIQRHGIRTERLIVTGLWISAGLFLVCLATATILSYTFIAQATSETALPVQSLNMRLALSGIAIFIALAFGCLGYGLFLIQAKGSFHAEMPAKQSAVAKVTTSAPGLVVITCATFIIWTALRMDFRVDTTGMNPGQAGISRSEPMGDAQLDLDVLGYGPENTIDDPPDEKTIGSESNIP